MTAALGVVAIGRNEGERLRASLESLAGCADAIVYVDSGSTDGSVELAHERGATVVELDPGTPFTAARARNAGFARLVADHPGIGLVQFVDGDCAIAEGWIAAARAALASRPDLAIACGRRRERFPERSLWNRLCDVEWNTPAGDAEACGGDFLVRREAFEAVGGFDDGMIAGEEPELCLRLRAGGWRIARLPNDMTWHDAAMTRFGQWWRRAVRAGHAYAETTWKHGTASGRHGWRPLRSIALWAVLLPLVALASAPWSRGASLLLLFGAYAVLWWRVRRAMASRATARDVDAYAALLVLAKFAQLRGAATFLAAHLRGRRSSLIEYKDSSSGTAGLARPDA